MNLPLFIAKRLRVSGRRGGKAPSVPVAVSGVALSLAVMILTVAIVVGFKREITDKVRGFDAELKIKPTQSITPDGQMEERPLSQPVRERVASLLPGANVSLMAMAQGVLKTPDSFAGVAFTGYDANHDWSFIQDNLVEGEVPDFTDAVHANDIVISATVASALQLSVGNRVDTYFFNDGNLRVRKFNVAGVYDTHFSDYDRLQCFASLSTVRKVAGLDSVSAHAVEVRGLPSAEILPTGEMLEQTLFQDYVNNISAGKSDVSLKVENVSRTGEMYFNWLDLLDTNVVVILILMGCVSSFTLVSCLFTLVLERVNMIGQLKALGATDSQITKMFMWLAARIALIGMLIGNVIGLGIALLQWYFRFIPLDPEAYYLTSVPIYINWWHIGALNLGVLAVLALVLLVPSRMISKVSPASTMRYE